MKVKPRRHFGFSTIYRNMGKRKKKVENFINSLISSRAFKKSENPFLNGENLQTLQRRIQKTEHLRC